LFSFERSGQGQAVFAQPRGWPSNAWELDLLSCACRARLNRDEAGVSYRVLSESGQEHHMQKFLPVK
jgi:hypothetical protein